MYTNILVGLARNYSDESYAELLTGWSRLLGGTTGPHHGPRPRGRRTS